MKKLLCLLLLLVTITECDKAQPIEKTKNQEIRTSQKNSEVPKFFSKSVIKNVNWEESPLFSYEGLELRGIKGKIGILSTPWKAGVANKYMWHFFGDDIPSGEITVIAVKKGTSQPNKALMQPDSENQSWSSFTSSTGGKNHIDVPSNMKLPSNGLWVLNTYIGKELFGQVVVSVE